MDDTTLNPTTEPVPATTRFRNHRGEKTFHPAEKHKVGVLYLEIRPSDTKAVMTLVNQLKALAVDSWMIHGVAKSVPDRRTSVHVQVTQLPNAQTE